MTEIQNSKPFWGIGYCNSRFVWHLVESLNQGKCIRGCQIVDLDINHSTTQPFNEVHVWSLSQRRRVGRFPNTFKTLREFGEYFAEQDTKPEYEIYDAGMLMGGFTRVGLEDNLYLEKGVMAKSSAEQVEKIARIAGEHGLEPATPDEARQILGLKGEDKVKF